MNDYTLHYAFQRQDNPDNKWEGSKTDDTYAIIFDLGEFHSFFKEIYIYKAHFNWMCAVWYSGRNTGPKTKRSVLKSWCPHFLVKWPWNNISGIIFLFSKTEIVISETQNCGPIKLSVMYSTSYFYRSLSAASYHVGPCIDHNSVFCDCSELLDHITTCREDGW